MSDCLKAPPLRTQGDESAFPVQAGYYEDCPGMSFREWLAGRALQGIVGNPCWNAHVLDAYGVAAERGFAIAARLAFAYADAMLAEGGKEGKPCG